jgi:Papain family cysteine protease
MFEIELLTDLPALRDEVENDPVLAHLGRLGYRSVLHLAAVLATPYARELLKPRNLPVLRTIIEQRFKALFDYPLSLRETHEGPELARVFSYNLNRYGGWVPTLREAEFRGGRLGRPIPAPERPEPLPPPATDDWATPLPPERILQGWPRIDNQGSRGTCVAFVVADLYLQACLREKIAPITLSIQYLYALAKRDRSVFRRPDGTTVDLKPIDGTTFEAALWVLQHFGACPDSYLGYDPEHDFGQFHRIYPPDPPIHHRDFLQNKAREHRIDSYRRVRLNREAVKRELFNHRAVAVGLPLYEIAWGNPVTSATGEVAMPLTVPDHAGEPLLADQPAGGHAITLIGYRDEPEGAFLFRNSWGGEWAQYHQNRRGQGWLPYAYLEQHAQEAYVIEKLK